MLDSLVRVSRRVGWATDPPRRPRAPLRGRTRPEASGHGRPALGTVPTNSAPRARPSAPALPRTGSGRVQRSSVRRCAPGTPVCKLRPPPTPRGGGLGRPPFAGALDHRSNRSRALGPGEVRPAPARGDKPAPSLRIRKPRAATRWRRRAESPGPTLRAHPFASQRFHVLLNSLFKVLFNFPSRYLFAIGLVPVFSLRWSLPPVLGLHSQTTRLLEASDGARPTRARA